MQYIAPERRKKLRPYRMASYMYSAIYIQQYMGLSKNIQLDVRVISQYNANKRKRRSRNNMKVDLVAEEQYEG